MVLDEFSKICGKNCGETLRIISRSTYFFADDIIHILTDFINKYSKEEFNYYVCPNWKNHYFYEIISKTNKSRIIFRAKYFQDLNEVIHLLAFEHVLSEIGEKLFSVPNLQIVDKDQRAVEKTEGSFDVYFSKCPKAKDFINYLFGLQVQNNGKHLTYDEMQVALNDFLSKEKDKPKQKIKEKNN